MPGDKEYRCRRGGSSRKGSTLSGNNNYRRSQQWSNREDHHQPEHSIRSEELSDLPGFSFDVVTKKYYKVLPNVPGQPSGSTRNDLKLMNREYALKQRQQASKRRQSTTMHILPSLLRDIEIGGGHRNMMFPSLSARRVIEEERIRHVRQIPSYNFEVMDNVTSSFEGCQFLDVKEEGEALIGCWGVVSNEGDSSQVVSYKVSVNSTEAERESRRYADGKADSNGRHRFNTYGLRFELVDNYIYVDSTLVDMAIAPADADVTCIVYATANSIFSDNFGIRTRCRIFLKAVEQLTKEEGKDSMCSPIYNVEWMTENAVWSCAFDSSHMRIGVGMEKFAAVFDVLTEKKFKVSSGGKTVIAQQYSKEGNMLHLGRIAANISTLDLRMSNNHTVGEFVGSESTCFMHQMENRPNQILSDNFDGKLKLWDNRTRSCVLEFPGHKNSCHKVPVFVDANEFFVFAVGEDATARGWSLKSGELLCSIDCPQSVQANSAFPRIVYSDRWGGLNGNSAIILAGLKGDISVHELLL